MTFVELTPDQALILGRAHYAEKTRQRHEKEGWSGQASRDAIRREEHIQTAIQSGVPSEQVYRFVYHPEEGEK